jgi:DNA-binding CsgD family transcriptional regulator
MAPVSARPHHRAMTNVTIERVPPITPRQRDVIVLIAAGCSNDEVSERLGISPRTVKAHCDVLRQKLGVRRRRQLPIAYRSLTGDDPLAQGLGPSGSGS